MFSIFNSCLGVGQWSENAVLAPQNECGKSLILCKTLKGAKLRWDLCGNLHKNLADLLQGTPCKCGRMPAELARSQPKMANLHLDLEFKRAQTE